MKAIAVVGPTASGKSALALELARRFDGEILSCDSMQVYRGMDIGTAKATAAERAEIPHHLLDIAEPGSPFSAADYAIAAKSALLEVTGRGRLPIFCGGTGLYLEAALGTRCREAPGADPAVRIRLNAEAECEGGHELLWERLRRIDPAAAAATHPNNLRRVIRALELFEVTGKTKTEWDEATKNAAPDFDCLIFGIRYTDRELLRQRIDARVDEMAAAGLADEARRLFLAGVLTPGTTAGQAIGYRQLLPFLAGEDSLSSALDAVKTATRQYAKRQMTWFGAMPGVLWLDAPRPVSTLADEAMPRIRDFLC